ncbi:MAG: ketoacyl-ACP synthase III [Candidatus Eremiobacteraeota bacterium]|nr:ketoacyl-ACP synthase III [Candidatus Eremiobacteraeota bacterium]MBC5803670.1 ketoacyl-ACP synthase III [Candidatus Eremiobacteraeota bacterium]MBC5821495.1 ketoacyl-ACP synthase III [Candidatus Eremiobacteraeota bacterium]
MSNADLERIFDTSDEWIVTRTGMRERRYAAPGEASSDLSTEAARHALDRAGLRPEDIDCYVVATVTPDFQFPATACIVASNLGAVGKAAFDIEIACSGFIYGLPMAASFVRAGVFRRVMIIGVETLSRITNMEDRGTCILFGDGAGATIVERTQAERDSFLSCELGADGRVPELLYVHAGGSRNPMTQELLDQKKDKVEMSGREIYKYAVNKMVGTSKNVLAAAGYTAADVDWIIPHQANLRIIEAAAKRLEVPREKIVVNIERYGNTSSATIPIALSETIERGDLHDGDLIVFTGFGGGLSWGSIAWKWIG